MSGIFDQPKKVDAFALSLAKSLFKAVKSSRRLKVKPKPDRVIPWGRLFELWLTEENEERVERVLEWYCKNINKDGCPQAYAAQGFKDKFEQIAKHAEKEADEVETIQERNMLTASKLTDELEWPVEIRTRLPVIIQRTRQSWEKFCKVMQGKCTLAVARKAGFLERVLAQSGSFTDIWMVVLSQKYGWMQRFTGSPLDLAFRPDSILFKESFWRSWSMDYCTDPKAFDGLLEELLKKE